MATDPKTTTTTTDIVSNRRMSFKKPFETIFTNYATATDTDPFFHIFYFLLGLKIVSYFCERSEHLLAAQRPSLLPPVNFLQQDPYTLSEREYSFYILYSFYTLLLNDLMLGRSTAIAGNTASKTLRGGTR